MLLSLLPLNLLPCPLPAHDGAGEAAGVVGQEDRLLDFRFGGAVLKGPADVAAGGRLQPSTDADADLDQLARLAVQRPRRLDRPGDPLVGLAQRRELAHELLERLREVLLDRLSG